MKISPNLPTAISFLILIEFTYMVSIFLCEIKINALIKLRNFKSALFNHFSIFFWFLIIHFSFYTATKVTILRLCSYSGGVM